MSETVKFLILGIFFAIVAVITFNILDSGNDRIKDSILEAYGFKKDGIFWSKPGRSITTETVEKMSIGMLVDYLEQICRGEKK